MKWWGRVLNGLTAYNPMPSTSSVFTTVTAFFIKSLDFKAFVSKKIHWCAYDPTYGSKVIQ